MTKKKDRFLWTSEEAKKATKGKGKDKWTATGVSIDTRTLEKGDLYIAIEGDNFDGHDFVSDAFKKGAAAAVVSKDIDDLPKNASLLKVADTYKALWSLASYRRSKSESKIIAVTGSVGKTTVKDALGLVLGQDAKTYATEGNLNNHIGLPLSICRLSEECEFGVFELGMNHAGELSELSKLLQPNIAVITAIEAVHMEFFNSVEEIADAKAEIFDGIVDGGTAVIPTNTPHFERLKKAASKRGIENIVSFGSDSRSNCRLIGRNESDNKNSIRASINDNALIYNIAATGKHNAINSLAVFAAAQAAGLDDEKIINALAKMISPEGRGKIFEIKKPSKYTLIDDSYNASPASMRASFEVLSQVKKERGGRAIAVLGDMLELGENSPKFHADLVEDIVKSKIDRVFTAGDLMTNLYNKLPDNAKGESCKTAKELSEIVKKSLNDSDIVLVKGSHGSEIWKLAAELKKGSK